MKNLYKFFKSLCVVLIAALTFTACDKEENGNTTVTPPVEPPVDNYEGIKANILVDATYYSGSIAGNGEYYIVFSDVENDADYNPTSTGLTVFLDLYNTAAPDPVNAVLPAGKYVVGEDKSDGTWNPQYTYIKLMGDDGQVVPALLTAGEVNVEYEEGIYTITLDATVMGAEEISCRYKGPIMFIEGKGSGFERFTEDINVTFETGSGRYYANQAYHHADDFSLYLRTGNLDESGAGTDGYYMLFQGFGMKIAPEDPVAVLAGTYNSYPYQGSSYYLPFTFKPGSLLDYQGELMPTGTYIMHKDEITSKTLYGFVKGGTMTYDGTSYIFDLVLENDVKATLVFEGNLNMSDKRDEYLRYSSLTGDRVLNLTSTDTEVHLQYRDQTLVENWDEWMLQISNPNGDFLAIGFMTEDSNGELPLGEYTVGHRFVPNEIIPGFYNNGNTNYSWYGDCTTMTPEGSFTVAAPIYGGKMTVEKNGEEYTLTFDFIDDAIVPNKITGQWQGTMNSELIN